MRKGKPSRRGSRPLRDLHPWFQVVDMIPAEAEIYRALVKEFRTQGVGVSLPQREIFLLSGASHAMAA